MMEGVTRPDVDMASNLADAPALRRLSDALWARAGSGAAVLIGAGFSRQCDRPDVAGASPPLWSDLAIAMAKGLGRSENEARAADPLRLAETYETAFGRAALVNLVRQEVNDEAWRPGAAHTSLLDLPWADILTTNFDTLLERASSGSARGYGVVRREGDLSGLRAPRIIKLHGTIEDDVGLVITEEDYRRYPDTQAAMVNTARQALIENDLCLLGFSGDDPNFRAWVGWVRDRLRGLHRRVFLVGPLNLDPIDRRVLERLGVIPIDLSPVVPKNASDPHKAAIDWLLIHLADQAPPTPSDWKPLTSRQLGHPSTSTEQDRITKDSGLLAENLRAVLRGWRQDRAAYPGWLICPWEKRQRIRSGTDAPLRIVEAIDAVGTDESRDVLLEIGWRHDVASDALPPWLAERLDQIAPLLTTSCKPELVRATVAARMSAARAAGNLEETVEHWSHLTSVPEVAPTIAYARLSDAIDRLDVDEVSARISEISGDDPIWPLRRAAGLAWLGDEEKARQLVSNTWSDLLDRCRRQPLSIALRSRLAWVRFVSNAVRELGEEERFELPRRFRIDGYDPWTEINHCDAETGELERKSREQQVVDLQFRAGVYREPGRTLHFGSQTTPADELARLRERVGLPFGTRSANILRTRTERAILASEDASLSSISRALAAGPSEKGPLLGQWINRIGVAALEDDVSRELTKRCERLVEHWLSRMKTGQGRHVAMDRMPVLIEVLARLAVRGSIEDAERHAHIAGMLAKSGSWHAIAKHSDHLLENAIDTLPSNERWRVLPEVIRYPLSGERDDHYRNTTRLYAHFSETTKRPEGISNRVAELMSMLSAEDRRRADAVHLLFVLHKLGVLLPIEASRFGELLWADVPEDGLPSGTDLYPDVFMTAPVPRRVNVEQRLRAKLFGADLISQAEFVARAIKPVTGPLPPEPTCAAEMFDRFAGWLPEPLPQQDPFVRILGGRDFERELDETRRTVSDSLGSLCWHLDDTDRTPDRLKILLLFAQSVGSEEALTGCLAFPNHPEIIKSLRRLASTGAYRQTYSFSSAITIAIHRGRPIPRELVDSTITATAFQPPAAIHVLLSLCKTLAEADLLTEADVSILESVLDDLWTRLDYTALAEPGVTAMQTMISASLTRAAGVGLAEVLGRKGITEDTIARWRRCVDTDPLPEVRHALND